MRKIHRKTAHQNIELIPYGSAASPVRTHIPQLLDELHLIISIVYKSLIKQRSIWRPSKHHIGLLVVVHHTAQLRHPAGLPERPRLGRVGMCVQTGLL